MKAAMKAQMERKKADAAEKEPALKKNTDPTKGMGAGSDGNDGYDPKLKVAADAA